MSMLVRNLTKGLILCLRLLPVLTFINCSFVYAKLSTTMLDSLLLINLNEINDSNLQRDPQQRRSIIPDSTLEEQIENNQADQPSSLNDTIASTFESSHEPPSVTNVGLTKALTEAFSLDEAPPTLEDFEISFNNLSDKKQSLGLTNKSFLSISKSMLSSFLRAGGEVDTDTKLPLILFSHILPNINDWGGNVSDWVKSIAQISVESFLEEDRPLDEIAKLSSSFASNSINLIDTGRLPVEPLNPTSIQVDIPDSIWSNENIPLSDKLKSGQTFPDYRTRMIQQLSVGITQGYMSVNDFNRDGLSESVIETFTQASSSPSSLNSGTVQPSIVSSFINGLMNATVGLSRPATQNDIDTGLAISLEDIIPKQRELLLYESIKASANGFLIATTVATTSKAEYLDEVLYLNAAEKISKQISQSVILNNSLNNDNKLDYSVSKDWVKADRLAESASSGASMGSQLATVLPKSMDYSNSWEISTNIRREIAKSVSKGSSYGSVNASAWLSTQPDPDDEGESILKSTDLENIASGTALGAMIGNTGLAIYYPTDQLVPIINFTAQGSGFGSLSAENLSLVNSETTESIDVSVARKTALGAALGASFEPTVLLSLDPAGNSREKNTVDHLTAASFGSTFGSILGIQENTDFALAKSNGDQNSGQKLIEIKQSSKQGSIEGALAGAKLALNLDEVNNETLKSKSAILKAINKANIKAASDSNNNFSSNSLRTSTKDMQLLMKKFGINPRYTNPAKMYKRPVVVQVYDPPIDEDSKEAISNASPL